MSLCDVARGQEMIPIRCAFERNPTKVVILGVDASSVRLTKSVRQPDDGYKTLS
jgi:hypothetical protein